MAIAGVLTLSPQDFDIVQRIFSDHVSDRPVFISGSRVTGRARRRSELDLVIGGDAPLDRATRADLREAFSESDLPIEVDIVDLAEATGIFRARIQSEWIPWSEAAKQLALEVTA